MNFETLDTIARLVADRPIPAVAVMAYERGASIFRVHDVREHIEALTAARALAGVTR